MTNEQYYQNWAENHRLINVTFWWYELGVECEIRLHNRTFNQALQQAQAAGFVEPRWYKPWTWANGVVTMG